MNILKDEFADTQQQQAFSNDIVEATFYEQQKPQTDSKPFLFDQEGGLLSDKAFGTLLNRDHKTVSRLFDQKKIIGYQTVEGRTTSRLYPAWQINNGQLIPHLDELISTFGDNGVQLMRFMLLRSKLTNNHKPLILVQQGQMKQLLNALKDKQADAQ